MLIPSNAPFSPEQIGWLNGYLAVRMQAQGAATPAQPTETTTPQGKPLTILWGSQTGNSETLAKKASKTLTAAGHQVTITDMAEAEADQLTQTENLLVITSTYGDGEPPDNAQALHELLHSDSAPRFENTTFSVLGLGDSEYPDFNQCAKEFDTVLEKLGAQRLAPLIESDVDYDDPFDEWVNNLTGALAS
ncbi:MAG: flavodoxin domain-containing protein [Roseibacillus sp.]